MLQERNALIDFDVRRYAVEWFKRGNIHTQRAIFTSIGTNWTLKDKKLSGNLYKYFFKPGEEVEASSKS